MGNRISLKAHLTTEQLQARFKSSRRPTERDRFHMLWLLSMGKSTAEVAEVTTFGVRGIRRLVKRYNEGGPDSMRDNRRDLPGATPRLTDEQCLLMEKALGQDPPDGGLWTGKKLIAWVEANFQLTIKITCAYEYLQRLDYALKTPRRRHLRSNSELQDEFKKKLSQTQSMLLQTPETIPRLE
jgi:transposase